MWNKIVKKDNRTLPPARIQVIFLASTGEIFVGWREGDWSSVLLENGRKYNHKPHWYIFGPRGRRMECTADVVNWMPTPELPKEFERK